MKYNQSLYIAKHSPRYRRRSNGTNQLTVTRIEVVVFVLAVIVAVFDFVVLLDELPERPLTLEIPVLCKVVGSKGWINFCHTVV